MNGDNKALLDTSPEFLEKVRQLKIDWHKKYTDIGAEPTPERDGEGREIIRKRPDGYDYIIEAYMRKALDKHFPGWSWEDGTIQFLGEWIVSSGHLVIVDEYLLAFGLEPTRRFFGTGADRIQFKKGTPHTPENVVDIDKNVATANSKALKRAINRLCNIGDDVYAKRIEEEGAGSVEDLVSMAKPSVAKKAFMEYLSKRHVLASTACGILGVQNIGEITDWGKALGKIKEAL